MNNIIYRLNIFPLQGKLMERRYVFGYREVKKLLAVCYILLGIKFVL